MECRDHEAKLAEQYAVAEEFLDELVKRFLDGDRSRVVIVPGNHDIDWNTALKAMEVVDRKDMPANVLSMLHAENAGYRWDWKSLTLYRIRDLAMYVLWRNPECNGLGGLTCVLLKSLMKHVRGAFKQQNGRPQKC